MEVLILIIGTKQIWVYFHQIIQDFGIVLGCYSLKYVLIVSHDTIRTFHSVSFPSENLYSQERMVEIMMIHEEDAKAYTMDKELLHKLKRLYAELARMEGHSVAEITIKFADDFESLDGWHNVTISFNKDYENRLLPMMFKGIYDGLDNRLVEVVNGIQAKYHAEKPWAQMTPEEKAKISQKFLMEQKWSDFSDIVKDQEIMDILLKHQAALGKLILNSKSENFLNYKNDYSKDMRDMELLDALEESN